MPMKARQLLQLLCMLCASSNFGHVMGGWIDVDTAEVDRQTLSLEDGTVQHLVFSDEFNVEGRDFSDGSDPRWTAVHKNDYTNYALQYYNEKLVSTKGGYLNITTVVHDVTFEAGSIDSATRKTTKKSVTKHYQSGMLQGWNKFCFTGGSLEIRAKLPGKSDVGGLWPAMWLLGNFARATYVASSNNMWPWSYDTCDREKQPMQVVSACDRVEHYGLTSRKGRGAPEVDLLEAMPGSSERDNFIRTQRPYFSTSLQVAPGLSSDVRPTTGEIPRFDPNSSSGVQMTKEKELTRSMANSTHSHHISNGSISQTGSSNNSNDNSNNNSKGNRRHLRSFSQWYDHGISYGPNTTLNIYFYGMHLAGSTKEKSYSADAISANTNLGKTHFEEFHRYRLEWQPRDSSAGDNDNSPASGAPGYLAWYLDDKFLYRIDGSALDLTGAMVPEEPMYILLNTAMSSTWGFPTPCPDGCGYCTADESKNCFDCRRQECACSMPAGMCSNFPASFLIDYVRVYQGVTPARAGYEPLGCSTASHPTMTYISAHKESYMRPGDSEPLQTVPTGGGKCGQDFDVDANADDDSTLRSLPGGTIEGGVNDIDIARMSEKVGVPAPILRPTPKLSCGGETQGMCISGTCMCREGYTGPYCLASAAFDDIDYETGKGDMPVRKFVMPGGPFVVLMLLGLMALSALVRYITDRNRSHKQYQQLHEHPSSAGVELESLS